jgi:superfamily II DNA or RNA helicase
MAGNSLDDRKNCKSGSEAALPPLPSGVVPGALVAVRGIDWRVGACVDHDDCRELHLQAAGGDGRVLLWPFDQPAAVEGRRRPPRVVPLAAWAHQAGPSAGRECDPRAPRGTFRGDILPYQLAPAVAIASGTPRVLLADEVGLGKTIQAGWILGDLLAREPGARALVAVPAGLRDQWLSELGERFALTIERVDAAWLRAAVAGRPADVSPWAAPGAYLGSIDFLKRPDVARALAGVTWDLLVVDEAHTAAAPTDRHAALSQIAAAARRVVLISATPYSGDTAGLASLVALGALAGDAPPLMFRRSRGDVDDRRRRRHRFATVRIGRAEARLQRLLGRYTRDVWRGAPDAADGARLAMTILRKRALSSPAAARRSLARRLELLRGAAPTPRQLSLFDDGLETDDALPEAALATPGLADAGLESRWLAALVAAAERAVAADSKRRLLVRLIARARGEAVIVFTEYRDTLRDLAGALPGALQLHGGLAGGERAAVQRAFNDRGGILLATDAAAEGLNLQQRCRLLVNYELPWNPARLEQRIGRVDRIGQRRTVHAISLVARDTAEDLVVAALARRLVRVAATLGERDRLAAFLSDARTARSVIGGAALDAADGAAAAPPLPRPSAADYPVERIAAALAAGGVTSPSSAMLVSGVRARGTLRPGVVAVVRAAAIGDHGLVAQRPLLLHVADPERARPRHPSDARDLASRIRPIVERTAGMLPEIQEWFSEVTRVHGQAVRRRVEREQRMQGDRDGHVQVQPGLFDRRALREAEQRQDARDRRRREHARHVRYLAAALDLRLECLVVGVLVVWR